MRTKKVTPAIQVEFKRLMDKDSNGLLRPEAIVEAAEDPNHILHTCFEWDDGKAADMYRRQQATELIRSYKVEMPELKIEVRALTSLDLDRVNGGGFRWTLQVLERPDLRQELVRTAFLELTAIQNKYKHLVELTDIWDAIDAGKESIVVTHITGQKQLVPVG